MPKVDEDLFFVIDEKSNSIELTEKGIEIMTGDLKDKELDKEKLIGISALLVHVAKIDDNYTNKEKRIIFNFLKSFNKNEEEINKILVKAEKMENDSNQLLNFTNIIRNACQIIIGKIKMI